MGWPLSYSAEPVLDDTALVGRLRYVLAHGEKEGLVDRSAEWPGLTCLPQLLGPARPAFEQALFLADLWHGGQGLCSGAWRA